MIFISYSKQNERYAKKLAKKLIDEGFDIWIDDSKLRTSENWWEEIVRALQRCEAFVVVMSNEARQSRWVQREVALADNLEKPAFPLLLSGDNWEIYVLTQYEDVRGGKLPRATFYDKLDEAATRHRHRGVRVVDVQPTDAPLPTTLADAYQAPEPDVPTRRNSGRLVSLLVILLLVVLGGLFVPNMLDDDPSPSGNPPAVTEEATATEAAETPPGNQPPNVAPLSDQNMLVNITRTVPVRVSDLDGDTVELRVDTDNFAIASARIEDGNILIETYNNPGNTKAVVIATDGQHSIEVSFTITVTDPNAYEGGEG